MAENSLHGPTLYSALPIPQSFAFKNHQWQPKKQGDPDLRPQVSLLDSTCETGSTPECLRCRNKQNKWPCPKDAQESNRKATDRTINANEWLNYELQSERHHGKRVRDQEHTRKKSHLQVCHFEIFLIYLPNSMYLFCLFKKTAGEAALQAWLRGWKSLRKV